MGSFHIGFTGEFVEGDPDMAIGEIRLGEDQESFRAFVGVWTVEDYKASWIAALRHLVGGATTSCLITSLTTPADGHFVTTWPLYRVGDDVYLQNRLLFHEDPDHIVEAHAHELDPYAPWESVDPRETIDEDGQQISEWALRVEDIQEFLDTKSPA